MVKNINDICFIIQARLGSQRVPNKMIKPFAGTTLVDVAIEKILDSSIIPKENFYFSVHEQELQTPAECLLLWLKSNITGTQIKK